MKCFKGFIFFSLFILHVHVVVTRFSRKSSAYRTNTIDFLLSHLHSEQSIQRSRQTTDKNTTTKRELSFDNRHCLPNAQHQRYRSCHRQSHQGKDPERHESRWRSETQQRETQGSSLRLEQERRSKRQGCDLSDQLCEREPGVPTMHRAKLPKPSGMQRIF